MDLTFKGTGPMKFDGTQIDLPVELNRFFTGYENKIANVIR